ncbi:hypothetical protein HYS10_02110 [Candidatus Collierbacteria bacterium]|nr:hypothetical protein [Candidatus Collierbacteria bacterium]
MAIRIEINTPDEEGSILFPKETQVSDPQLAEVLTTKLGEELYQKILASRDGRWTLGGLSRQEPGDMADWGFSPTEESLLIQTVKDLKEPSVSTGAIATHGGIAAGPGGIAIGGNFEGNIIIRRGS